MAGWGVLRRGAVLGTVLLVLAGCETRSISDSGFRGPGGGGGSNPFYRGELTAYDVLGVDLERGVSEEEIQKALAEKRPIAIRKGSPVMLVQSGAPFPDHDMIAALERYYTVSAFTGVPLQDSRTAATRADGAKQAPVPYSRLFRLAAAKGGYETILVYWGLLESASEGLGTKAVSWVPIVGGSIPDQAQRMRIRLMMAVIDVRTGQWETLAPEPVADEATSSQRGRAASDQEQVALLKARGYRALAETLVQRYGR